MEMKITLSDWLGWQIGCKCWVQLWNRTKDTWSTSTGSNMSEAWLQPAAAASERPPDLIHFGGLFFSTTSELLVQFEMPKNRTRTLPMVSLLEISLFFSIQTEAVSPWRSPLHTPAFGRLQHLPCQNFLHYAQNLKLQMKLNQILHAS